MPDIEKKIDLKEKYAKVLEQFNSRHIDFDQLTELWENSISYVKEKYFNLDLDYRLACLYIVTKLKELKHPDVDTKYKEIIDSFVIYLDGHKTYKDNLALSKSDFGADLTYYNGFITNI